MKSAPLLPMVSAPRSQRPSWLFQPFSRVAGLLRPWLPLVLAVVLCLGAGVEPAWSLDAAGASEQPPGAADRADLQAGARLFEAHCVGCHVGGGNVIRRGRTLKLAALERADLASPDAIARVAAEGQGQMGGYGAVLGDQGAIQVGAWVWQQAQAGWPRSDRA